MDDRHEERGVFEDLFAQYVDRLNAGEGIDKAEIRRRFPQFADGLIEKLESYELLTGEVWSEESLGTIGDYTLRRQIGRGGMGVVYEAWQGSMDRLVALKVLPPGIAAEEKAFARFMREAKTAGRLDHRNIVSVHAAGFDESTPYYAMEFVAGDTLSQALAKIKDADADAETPFGKKNEPRFYLVVAEAFAGVADGLQHAHSKGVTHRDIKPSNLIFDGDGRLRILDFGLARLEGQESLTLSGDFVGTPLYMSPEQARRKKIPVDHRTDIYSLGATMYETLCGRPPFRGKNHADTLSQIIERDPLELRKVNPRVPKDLETIVLKCLRKDSADRYRTAEALGQDLRRSARGDPIEARPQLPLERLARRIVRERRRILQRALVVFLIAGCALSGFVFWVQARRAKNEQYENEVLQQKRCLLRNETILRVGSGKTNFDRQSMVLFFPTDLALFASGVNPVEGAVEKLRALAARLPGRVDAHYYLARGLLLLGRPDDARVALEDALNCNPRFIPARILKEELDDRRAASSRIEMWLDQEDGISWQPLWFEAYLAASERDWDTASRVYAELMELERETEGEFYLGSEMDLHLLRAGALIEGGFHEKARHHLAFVHFSHLGHLEPALLLAKTYYLDDNVQEARDLLEVFYATTEARTEVATSCAVFCISMGDGEQAVLWAKRLEDLSPEESSVAKRLEALAHFRLGETEEAFRLVEEVMRVDPKDVMARYLKAQFTYLQRVIWRPKAQRGEALHEIIRLCEEVVRSQKTYTPAHCLLALAYQEQGEPEKALEAYRMAPKNRPVNLMVLEPTSFMLYLMGNWEELRRIHREAREGMVDLSPREEAFFSGWSGIFHDVEGRQDHAVAAYEKAADLDSGLHWPLRNIGRIRFEQGNYGPAADYATRAISRAPTISYSENGSKLLFLSLERQDLLEEAIRVCCQSIAADPTDSEAHEDVLALLLRHEEIGTVGELERLADFLDSLPEGRREHWLIRRTLAFLRLRVPTRRDLMKAREDISRVVQTCRGDPLGRAILARAQHDAGERREAILTLEKAVRESRPHLVHSELLDTYRQQLLPDMVSFASIDAAVASIAGDRAAERALLLEFKKIACGSGRERRLVYLEGRLLQRAGEHVEAVKKFESLLHPRSSETKPDLRLAESLRDGGRREEAEAYLRTVLDAKHSGDRALWNLWLAICLDDLRLEPRQVLARFPGKVEGYAENIHWLLEQLDSGGALRINCGGEEHCDPSGFVWGRDRFARGGESVLNQSRVIGETSDEQLHQTTRRFLPHEISGGYRVPLPSGSYRLTVHMVDEREGPGADNPVNVLVEGNRRLQLQGYRFKRWCHPTKVVRHVFHGIRVDDGVLEIEFSADARWPQVSAIEIAPRR